MNRRAVLSAMTATVAGSALAATPRKPFFAAHDIPIGLELYTVGPDAQKDLDGTLKQVAAIGYRTVEIAGLYGHSPAEFRAALDRAGLKAPVAHIQAKGSFSFADEPGKLAADLKTLGVETAVLPMFPIPDRFGGSKAGEGLVAYLKRVAEGLTADDWKSTAALLNEKAAALKPYGLRVGYHNHNIEFAPVGGTTGFDMLVGATDPKLVTFEVDIGWVAASGTDPYVFLARHKGRVSMMHVKDLKAVKPNFAFQMDPAEIGSGVLDWKRLLPAAWDAGVRQFYVEQEPPFTRPRLEAAKIDHDYLAGVVA